MFRKIGNENLPSIFSYRDVLIKPLLDGKFLVVGCDSSGSVGPKPEDLIRVSGGVLGKFIVRTVLMEILAVGAKPLCIACGLGVEPKPTGASILRGIKREMRKVGLDPKYDLVISTEKNFSTIQTGIGVAAVGLAEGSEMLIGKCEKGDTVIGIGLPSVGMEVIENERKNAIADLEDLHKLLSLTSLGFVHAIIPVGSKGIRYEVNILAKESKLKVRFCEHVPVNLDKSAGPSTVILAAIKEDYYETLKSSFKKPIYEVATLI